MTDPYRITTTRSPGTPTTSTGLPPERARPGAIRRLLWLVLVVGMVGNTAASAVGVGPWIQLAFGAVTGLCLAALVAGHLRGRR